MSETKDYSLLRPFDLEAAKRGDKVYFVSQYPEHNDTGTLVAEKNGDVCIDWDGVGGAAVLQLHTIKSPSLRMAPLCWVEGRPLYRGDVLWWKPESRRVVVSNFDGDKNCPLIGEDRCFYVVENLTWTPPKVKREGWVNIYPRTGLGRLVNTSHAFETKHEADVMNGGNRIACVRIEWEEPAEVAK